MPPSCAEMSIRIRLVFISFYIFVYNCTEAFRSEANDCFMVLSSYIQHLNTNVNLYQCLREVTSNDKLMQSFTEEQRRMGILLRLEFERDGIHLPTEGRAKAVALQNDLTQLAFEFQQTLNTAQDYVQVPLRLVKNLPHHILSRCKQKQLHPDENADLKSDDSISTININKSDSIHPSVLLIPTDAITMNAVLKWATNPEIRKKIYIAGNTCAKSNLEILERLIKKRHELARLLGFETYAHLAICDKMAESPDAVRSFLKDLAERLMDKAKEEREYILKAKQEIESNSDHHVDGWDTPYYMGMLKAREYNLDAHVISSYFPLYRCIEGLGIICKSLFQMTLTEVPMEEKESWHPDVTKMVLAHVKEGIIGYIYFDLYPRSNKYNHAAHFTVRCGRKINEQAYQTPVVALVCNFSKPTSKQTPSLLSHGEVETLFHEFGHALHSLLSRTEFQHLSGTRAQLDFVETPSHLFEYFACDYRVVKHFAKHYKTNQPIPQEMMNNLRHSKNRFAAMDTQTQVLYSLLDLTLFAEHPLPFNPPTSTQVLKELQNSYTLIPYIENTYWHTRFGHLVGYGAGYYSYLYARVFAADIWYSSFAANPLSSEMGEKLYKDILIHGGAKDPAKMISAFLGKASTINSFLQELQICK